MAVIFELPERPGGKPVVVVAVEDDRVVLADAGGAIQFRECAGVDHVTPDAVVQIGLPVPADGVADVALVVGGGVNVHLHDLHLGVGEMFRDPAGADQHLGM